ncbi:MAG: hypothetical protein AMJ63_11530 [Myxococcales bacterium SG8_38_1]|jgi:uncharacterized protein YbcC (UPF0753/DUF2309 family)|nr:MAG: hypothetical protein AMJ63_11530 [Myxococcales bacterium SG8_38_1]
MPSVADIIDHAAHLLPQQSPLHMFVHHNTLHAFEHLHFERAVLEGAARFGTEPYQTEQAFAQCLETARIRPSDIDAVLAPLEDDSVTPIIAGGPTRRQLHALRLRNLFEIPQGAALHWMLEETGTLFRFHARVPAAARAAILQSAERISVDATPMTTKAREEQALEQMWSALLAVAPVTARPCVGVRRRDEILAAYGADTDRLVHPLLIRFCAAFVDQGIAYWQMVERKQGLLSAFRALYGLGSGPMDRWMRGLSKELRRQQSERWDAERTVSWALEELGVPEAEWESYVEETLLSLRGWAGMVRQLEERPDTAPVDPPPARLSDYLALQLTLDLQAARFELRQHAGEGAKFVDLPSCRGTAAQELDLELVYEAFILAQLAGVGPSEMSSSQEAKRWIEEVRAFDSNERRRLMHLAYERRHRIGVLDGIVGHCRVNRGRAKSPKFQAVFCIDDREESLRRHLEEIRPDAETYGYAGFFGVAMSYQGLEDIRPRPLCPVAVRPRHYVTERALDESDAAAFAGKRRRQGRMTHSIGLGSKMLTRGGLLSALFGFLAVIPLLGRSLFPRRTERLAHWALHRAAPVPPTRLCVEGNGELRPDGLASGYTLDEMADIVAGVLTTMGIEGKLCPLVLVVGHGSSSLNNPHEAAHDCGATGGGRGGPNARAFAQMANDLRVRERLRNRSLFIPSSTWFVGAYHNTCDDSMAYYDEDLLPVHLLQALEDAKGAFADACRFDAHERCRRFESAALELDPKSALIHAEAHAYDLAQPRPEYGHATNAVCIVGRRERTRGLFLDRRAFLVSYDPSQDPRGTTLAALLRSVGPVGAGINLEYYFSFVDPTGYGSGTKLPHNIVGLIGVMDGHASDLRTGLPWQMVEIHEPVRLLTIVETKTEMLETVIAQEAGVANLVNKEWIQLVAWDPDSDALAVYEKGRFRPYVPENPAIAIVDRSMDFYAGRRGHLSPAHVTAGLFAEGSA